MDILIKRKIESKYLSLNNDERIKFNFLTSLLLEGQQKYNWDGLLVDDKKVVENFYYFYNKSDAKRNPFTPYISIIYNDLNFFEFVIKIAKNTKINDDDEDDDDNMYYLRFCNNIKMGFKCDFERFIKIFENLYMTPKNSLQHFVLFIKLASNYQKYERCIVFDKEKDSEDLDLYFNMYCKGEVIPSNDIYHLVYTHIKDWGIINIIKNWGNNFKLNPYKSPSDGWLGGYDSDCSYDDTSESINHVFNRFYIISCIMKRFFNMSKCNYDNEMILNVLCSIDSHSITNDTENIQKMPDLMLMISILLASKPDSKNNKIGKLLSSKLRIHYGKEPGFIFSDEDVKYIYDNIDDYNINYLLNMFKY